MLGIPTTPYFHIHGTCGFKYSIQEQMTSLPSTCQWGRCQE